MKLQVPPIYDQLDSFGMRGWFQRIYRYARSKDKIATVTAAYQASDIDSVILINGDITVTLPTASSVPEKVIRCKAINAGGGTRTVSGNGTNIDGAATWTTTTQYVSEDFVSDGTQWWTI